LSVNLDREERWRERVTKWRERERQERGENEKKEK